MTEEQMADQEKVWTITYDERREKLATDKPFPVTEPVQVVSLAYVIEEAEKRASAFKPSSRINTKLDAYTEASRDAFDSFAAWLRSLSSPTSTED